MRKTPVSGNAFHGLFRRNAFGVDFQSLKKAAATRSQSHATLRRLLDSQRRNRESIFVATWQARRQIKRAAQYLGELLGDLMPQ
jgi:hypothetical protein